MLAALAVLLGIVVVLAMFSAELSVRLRKARFLVFQYCVSHCNDVERQLNKLLPALVNLPGNSKECTSWRLAYDAIVRTRAAIEVHNLDTARNELLQVDFSYRHLLSLMEYVKKPAPHPTNT